MKKQRRTPTGALSMLTLGVILLVWLIVTASHAVSGVMLPSPIKVVQTFFDLCAHGYNGTALMTHYGITMLRLVVAVVLAIVIGIPLGLLSGYVPQIRAVVDPIVQFIRPIPPLAYYTLLILWLGIGESSKISLLFLSAIPPIYIACFDAVQKVNLEYLQNAASLGASRWQIFRYVIFPSTVPDMFTGIRSAVGVAYTTIVSAEMIASSTGIGWMIIDASHYLKSDVMFVGILILGITGVVLDWLIKKIQQRLVRWSGRS